MTLKSGWASDEDGCAFFIGLQIEDAADGGGAGSRLPDEAERFSVAGVEAGSFRSDTQVDHSMFPV